jgi:hypothetical protein
MGWYPTKYNPDHGIDFVCQIRGDRTGEMSSEMSGKTLNVSVRSTTKTSDTIKIDRNDAELFLKTNSPIVIAIVKRAPLGQNGPIAIKFIDEQFIRELEVFLHSTAKTHTVHFSEAATDPDKIQNTVERLFQQPYMDMIARLRIELRLETLISEPQAEILHTAYGTVAYVHSKCLRTQFKVSQRVDVTDALRDIGLKVVFTPSSLIPAQNAGLIGARGDLNFSTSQEYDYPSTRETKVKSEVLDVFATMDQIRDELSVWNYDSALCLAERIEQVI